MFKTADTNFFTFIDNFLSRINPFNSDTIDRLAQRANPNVWLILECVQTSVPYFGLCLIFAYDFLELAGSGIAHSK